MTNTDEVTSRTAVTVLNETHRRSENENTMPTSTHKRNTFSDFELSSQQLAILDFSRPPISGERGRILRVTAAAGSGKTTILMELAYKLIFQLGHERVIYLSFNKIAKEEAIKKWMRNSNTNGSSCFEARTLHGMAFNLSPTIHSKPMKSSYIAQVLRGDHFKSSINKFIKTSCSCATVMKHDCFFTIQWAPNEFLQ